MSNLEERFEAEDREDTPFNNLRETGTIFVCLDACGTKFKNEATIQTIMGEIRFGLGMSTKDRLGLFITADKRIRVELHDTAETTRGKKIKKRLKLSYERRGQ